MTLLSWIFGEKRQFELGQKREFKFRIAPFTGDYVCFEYSLNGGKNWVRIHKTMPPFLDDEEHQWYWTEYIEYIQKDSTFITQKEMFSSWEKILDYEAEQKRIMNYENLKRREEFRQKKAARQEQLRKINEGL